MHEWWIGLFIAFLLSSSVESTYPNVALHKSVVGRGQWHSAAVDGNFHSTFAPDADQFPYYYVDLGAIYNLSSINLFCQDEWSFDFQGVNVSFDVHTYGGSMSPCNYQSLYPWDKLASNITFKRKGEEIVLNPTKPVQYIFIGHPNPKYPKPMYPIPIGEIQAHGEKLYETPVPQIPPDDTVPENYYKETRRAVIGNQDRIWMETGKGYFKPNEKYNDVVLGWDRKPNSMAITRGKARMVLVMGHAFPKEISYLPMYENIRTSCKHWLTNGSLTANYSKINSTYNPGDVLVLTRDDQFNVEEVYEQLTSGNNSALVGYPFRDQNDSLSELLKKMEVEFIRTNEPYDDHFVYVSGSADSNQFIPASYMVQRYVMSWKAFSTERFQVNSDDLGIKSEQVDKQVKALVYKYRKLMQYLAPCDTRGYVKDEKTATALINYNSILKYQTGGTHFSLPNIHRHPGKIPFTMKPTTVVATVYADLQGDFFPIGVYAKPGQWFRWTVLRNSDQTYTGQMLRINAQTDWIDHHSTWSRWPSISTELTLKERGKIVSPHGGPIFLQLPQGANVTIRLEDVYRYPWLDLRNPKTLETFANEINDYVSVPWLVISGDSMNSMLKTIDVYNSNTSEVISSARHFDNAIKVMHNYRGSLWENARLEMFVADIQISAGYGHSGYPWMGSIDWSYLFTLYSKSIKYGGQPGFVHELGHNLQVWDATMKNGGEVTNNVYHLIVEEIVLGRNPYQGDMDTGKWNLTEYQGPDLGYYRYLGKLFGYGLVGNGFIEARKNRPGNEDQKTQFWIKQMCNETGYNLLAFHEMWNFPISNDTRSACSALPCFFPDDEYTQPYEKRVEEVLKPYGKTCLRSNPKQVKFRGDIRRGVGTVRPQNIFLTFE